jgi:RNA recognition motif-containing protein
MSIFNSPVLDRSGLAGIFLYYFLELFVSTKLFVGSLPWAVDDKALQSVFEAHGTVVSAKVIIDRETGKSKGFGFVEMENQSDADSAINALNESELKGRNIVVNKAKPRS